MQKRIPVDERKAELNFAFFKRGKKGKYINIYLPKYQKVVIFRIQLKKRCEEGI